MYIETGRSSTATTVQLATLAATTNAKWRVSSQENFLTLFFFKDVGIGMVSLFSDPDYLHRVWQPKPVSWLYCLKNKRISCWGHLRMSFSWFPKLLCSWENCIRNQTKELVVNGVGEFHRNQIRNWFPFFKVFFSTKFQTIQWQLFTHSCTTSKTRRSSLVLISVHRCRYWLYLTKNCNCINSSSYNCRLTDPKLGLSLDDQICNNYW